MSKRREWVLATPAVSEADTVRATSADNAIAQAWDSGFLAQKLDALIGGVAIDDTFNGYVHTYVFPAEEPGAEVAIYDLRLKFVRRK